MSPMALKLHNWFKSYGNFADLMDFAYWLSFIEKGLRLLQPAQQSCFSYISLLLLFLSSAFSLQTLPS